MSGIFIPDTFQLKTYSSASKGEKASLTLVFETGDLTELGWTLHQLAKHQRERKATEAAALKAQKAAEKKTAARAKLAGLPAPRLGLPAPVRGTPGPEAT